eukprot:Polyplicarium_translucidae@DN3158_c0_g1_i1.p1
MQKEDGATEAQRIAGALSGEIKEDIVSLVLSMRLAQAKRVTEDQISGLDAVRKLMRDKIINPIRRPELHFGLHRAPRGILLFGPPGTGKTTLAKWIASESGAEFFEVTPSVLISKFHGETETIVKALFRVAEHFAPSVVFIDEVDSLLGLRREKDDDSTIRMKNQLMQMMDGISSDDSRMVVIVGATNRPDMLDNAALRRLTKRVLVPLPDFESRLGQVRLLLRSHRRSLGSDGEVPIDGEGQQAIARMTEGWNCSDLKVLCAKAAEVSYDETVMEYGGIDKVPDRKAFRDLRMDDFTRAFEVTHSSAVSDVGNVDFSEWERTFGSG